MLGAIFSWAALRWLLIIVYVPACVGLIAIVLLQKGKGTGFAGAFGIGPGSDAVFGPRASRSLPVKLTYIFASIFIVLALTLSFLEDKIVRGDAPQLVTDEAAVESSLIDEGLGSAYSDEEPAAAAPVGEGGPAETAPVESGPVEGAPTDPAAAEQTPGANPSDTPPAVEDVPAEGTETPAAGIDATQDAPSADVADPADADAAAEDASATEDSAADDPQATEN